MDQIISLPQFTRRAEIRSQSFDKSANTIDVVFTTGATVRRNTWMDGPYDEELVVSANAVRLDRLNLGAPFLNAHNQYDLSAVIGAVVPGTARIESGEGLATIELSRAPEDQSTVAKITGGLIRNISAGYFIHRVEKTEADDGSVAVWKVVDWEPAELSAVPIPADPGAQVRSGGRQDAMAFMPCTISLRRGNTDVNSGASRALARMRMRSRELGLRI